MKDRTNNFLLFLVISLTVRGLYLSLFANCFSQDLVAWNRVSDLLSAGENPYHAENFLSWPPFWMQLIYLFTKISLVTHLSLNAVIRIFLIATESCTAWLLYSAMIRFGVARHALKLLIFGIALNPVSIFQVCQHCNFDVLVGFWVLLAVYLLLRFQEQYEPGFWLLACLALGMGALTKTVPLSLSPLLLLAIGKIKWPERVVGLVLLLGPMILALSVIYVLAPADVQSKVLGYRGVPGGFGFSGIFIALGADWWVAAWPRIFEIIYGAGWITLGAWLLGRDALNRRTIVLIAVTLLLAIVVLGPGKGLQYVNWFLPLLVLLYGLAETRTRIYLGILYAVASVSYAIEYAFSYNIYGSFLLGGMIPLNSNQAEWLIKLGLNLTSSNWETMVTLPLWLGYAIFLAGSCRKIGMEIKAGSKTLRPPA